MAKRRNKKFILRAPAVVEMAETHRHFLKLRGGFRGQQLHTEWLPLSAIEKPTLSSIIADRFGHILDRHDQRLVNLHRAVRRAPRIVGIARLGWSPNAGALVKGRRIIYRPDSPPSRLQFVAPEGTLLENAVEALRPRGNRRKQYRQLKRLWKSSKEARLVLSLAAVSPFLELLQAPTVLLHVAGTTGFGKTTIIRHGVSLFANPDLPLMVIDFSKDTPNYWDAKLGIVRNFPMLLDETTTRSSADIIQAAYNIVDGKTKGRLTGPEGKFLPAEPLTYRLVCFLTGERSRRDLISHPGGAARWSEIVLKKRIRPKAELSSWYRRASEHCGWLGYDLIRSVIARYPRRDGVESLAIRYRRIQRRIARWCTDHPRMVDFLALVELGHYLISRQLFDDFGPIWFLRRRLRNVDAANFTRWAYARLNKDTSPAQIVGAIRALPGIRSFANHRFIPHYVLRPIAKRYGLRRRGELLRVLKESGIVQGTGPRQVTIDGERKPKFSYLLSPKGMRRLAR